MRWTCVSTQMLLQALEAEDEHQVGRLPAHARQHHQLFHRLRHLSAEAIDEHPAAGLHVLGLVAVEADRVDQPLDFLDGELRHRARRPRHLEQPRRCGVRGRVLGARREQRRDEDLKGVFGLLVRDLLDRRQLEPRRWRAPATASLSRQIVRRGFSWFVIREGHHDSGDQSVTNHGPYASRMIRTGVNGGWPLSTAIDVAHGEIGHRGPRLGRAAGHVRREEHVLERQQVRVHERLLLVDVERGAGDQPVLQRPGQRRSRRRPGRAPC